MFSPSFGPKFQFYKSAIKRRLALFFSIALWSFNSTKVRLKGVTTHKTIYLSFSSFNSTKVRLKGTVL